MDNTLSAPAPSVSPVCNGKLTSLFAASLFAAACATTSGARSGEAVTDAKLQERNQALANAQEAAFTPCASKGKADDAGIIVVSARSDGSLALGPMLWLGSAELQRCIETEAVKIKLPPWPGPTVSWLWALGTRDHPAPQQVNEPPNLRSKQQEWVMRAQGNSGIGNDANSGPLAACAQRSLPPDSYVRVTMRLFIFPDGKVVGATPIASEGQRDAAYIDCVADVVRTWQFDSFPGPAFLVTDVPLKRGSNPIALVGQPIRTATVRERAGTSESRSLTIAVRFSEG